MDYTVQMERLCVGADLWDILLEELRVRFRLGDRCGFEQSAVVDSGRIQIPTGAAGDDACRLGCQVNGTCKNKKIKS